MNWNDLALDERLAVERIAHGPQLLTSVEMADRLRILGLVDESPAGLVLSHVGAWVYAERGNQDRSRWRRNAWDHNPSNIPHTSA